ncbi:MAG: hypothetical protein ACOXZZ_02155 [Sphaerochaetaceae bacterium]|jgi:DNA polymerase III delta prime subunit
MFDSYSKYRGEITSLLKEQLISNTFSSTSLFSGERYSGRLTIALEVARIFSCSLKGESDCSCYSCTTYNNLKVDNLVVVGSRNNFLRIKAALENYRVLATSAAKKELFKTVRVFLLQYRALMYDSTVAKSGPLFERAGRLDELLDQVEQSDDVDLVINTIEKGVKEVQSVASKQNQLTIMQVRSLQRWVNQTSFKNRKRFLIIEGIEKSSTGSLNSLLKLLEEPPKDTYIIVLSEQPSRLPATILSRLRKYHFKNFAEKEKNDLLRDKFFVKGEFYLSLEEFFLERGKVDFNAIKKAAQTLSSAVVNKKNLMRQELEEIGGTVDEVEQLEYFFKEFEKSLKEFYYNNLLDSYKVDKLIKEVRESYNNALVFNQNGRLLVEALYYRLVEI